MLNQADTITCNFTATLSQLFPSYFGLIGFILNGKEKDHLHVNPRKDLPLKPSSYILSPFCSYKSLSTSYSNHITKNLQSNITHSKCSQMSHRTLYILDLLASLQSNHQLITGLTIEHHNCYICSDMAIEGKKIFHFIFELK